jgi:hypothetical protein
MLYSSACYTLQPDKSKVMPMPDEISVASTTDTPEQVAEAIADLQPDAPTVPPVTPPAITPPADTPPPADGTTTPPESEREQDRVERRIARMRYERAQSDTRAAAAEAKVKELEAEIVRRPTPTPAAAPGAPAFAEAAPKLDDFETAQEWAEAYNGYTSRLVAHNVQHAITSVTAKTEADRRATEQATVVNSHISRINKFRESHPDFDQLANVIMESGISVGPEVQQHLVTSEMGPTILYHLAKNMDEMKRIAALPPVAALVEIGILQARLSTPAAPADGNGNAPAVPPAGGNPPPAPRPAGVPAITTPPPPPIAPLGGGGNAAATVKDPDSMTQEEYNAWRDAGGGR